MTIREIIVTDIVEDISTYKNIYNNFIDFIKEDINENYKPSFTFDEFCVKMMENFENIDDDIRRFFDETGRPLTGRMMKSLMNIAFQEFKNDDKSLKKLQQFCIFSV